MNSTEFPQKNYTLKAGGNPNTVGLPCAIASNKATPGYPFYVSKWIPNEQELAAYKDRVTDIVHALIDHQTLRANGIGSKKELIDKIVEIWPPVYLAAMGAPTPVMVLAANPFEEGWMEPLDAIAAALNKPNSHPKDN